MLPPTRLTRLVATAFAASSLLIAACSSDGDPTAAEVDPEPGTEVDAAVKDLVGRYAHYDAVAYQDDTMKTIIISAGLADLELRAGELWNAMTFCSADVASEQGIQVTISDAATHGSSMRTATATRV